MKKWIKLALENNIKLNWTDIKFGVEGFENDNYELSPLLSEQDIEGYAQIVLESSNLSSSILDKIGNLFSQDFAEKKATIDSLSEFNELDSYYKWRWLQVQEFIFNLNEEDFVKGLLKISEFWLDMFQPMDSPYEFQGFGNNLNPQEFYTQNNYNKIIQKHKDWLEKEKNRFS